MSYLCRQSHALWVSSKAFRVCRDMERSEANRLDSLVPLWTLLGTVWPLAACLPNPPILCAQLRNIGETDGHTRWQCCLSLSAKRANYRAKGKYNDILKAIRRVTYDGTEIDEE
ncbi:hypothetical protein V1477_004260 [Vespula maculifrons]|uniref:Uncharacterized protein n=1 Tax=Vespula maculifrons TaxID=7453 RepID=A0ABD2CR30_VESMC